MLGTESKNIDDWGGGRVHMKVAIGALGKSYRKTPLPGIPEGDCIRQEGGGKPFRGQLDAGDYPRGESFSHGFVHLYTCHFFLGNLSLLTGAYQIPNY